MMMKKMAHSGICLILLCIFFGNAMYGQGLADRLNLTREKLQQDRYNIVNCIFDIAGWIKIGLKTPDWAAWLYNGIEKTVYKSMPKVFIEEMSNEEKLDRNKIEIAFLLTDFNDDSIKYIKEDIEELEKQRERPVHPNTVGKILYGKLVDNLSISDNDKEILKKKPDRMQFFIEKKIVKKDEYIHFNMLNLTAQYYLNKYNIIYTGKAE